MSREVVNTKRMRNALSNNTRKSFVRERTIEAGPYKLFSIYTRTMKQELEAKEPRGRRKKVSTISKQRWNEHWSQKRAELKFYKNFGEGDYYGTWTHNSKFMPKRPEDFKKYKDSVLKQLQRLYKKEGFEFRYMWFTSYQFSADETYVQRIHHHVIFSSGPSRDDIEACWSRGSGKNKKKIGRTDLKIIQPDEDGSLKSLAYYLTHQGKWDKRTWKNMQKRWSTSQNLKEPTETTNDSKWSQRKLAEIGFDNGDGADVILAMFPGYKIIGDIYKKYDDDRGWYVSAELLKIENKPRKKRKGRP